MNNILEIKQEIKNNETGCEQETEKFNIQTKSQIFNICVAPIVTYAAQTWTLRHKVIFVKEVKKEINGNGKDIPVFLGFKMSYKITFWHPSENRKQGKNKRRWLINFYKINYFIE